MKKILLLVLLFISPWTVMAEKRVPEDSLSSNSAVQTRFYFKNGKVRQGIVLEEKAGYFVVKTKNGKIVKPPKSALVKVVDQTGKLLLKDSIKVPEIPADSGAKQTVVLPVDTSAFEMSEPKIVDQASKLLGKDSAEVTKIPADSSSKHLMVVPVDSSASDTAELKLVPALKEIGDTTGTSPSRPVQPAKVALSEKEKSAEPPKLFTNVEMADAMHSTSGDLSVFSDKLVFHDEEDTTNSLIIPLNSVHNIKEKRLLRLYTLITAKMKYRFILYTLPQEARQAILENWKKVKGGGDGP